MKVPPALLTPDWNTQSYLTQLHGFVRLEVEVWDDVMALEGMSVVGTMIDTGWMGTREYPLNQGLEGVVGSVEVVGDLME